MSLHTCTCMLICITFRSPCMHSAWRLWLRSLWRFFLDKRSTSDWKQLQESFRMETNAWDEAAISIHLLASRWTKLSRWEGILHEYLGYEGFPVERWTVHQTPVSIVRIHTLTFSNRLPLHAIDHMQAYNEKVSHWHQLIRTIQRKALGLYETICFSA